MSKRQQIEDMYAEMSKCTKCPRLVETRKQVVRGRGNPDASRIVLVGEGPGPEENKDGEAFVGKSGRKLDSMLAKLGDPKKSDFIISEDDVYIFNSVSCWPTQLNRLVDPPQLETAKPTAEEIANCRPWLERLIRIIDPMALILAGEYACLSFGLKGAMTGLQGKMVDVQVQGINRKINYCAMPIYHPAFLLRSADKPQLEEITQRALRALVDRAWACIRISKGMSPMPVGE